MADQYEDLFRNKFETFNALRKEMSDEEAWEKMLDGYPERQLQKMGQYINNATLVEGFRKAIPYYSKLGMVMDAVDISNNGMDAVLEIQRVCPYLEMAKGYGVEDPCHLLCDMDVEATKRAFPDMKVRYVCRQSKGDCVCAYKYERPARK